MNRPRSSETFSLLRVLAKQCGAGLAPRSVLLMAALTGCGHSRVSAADLLNGVTPFNALEGVALGTKARDLVERRPAVTPAPYVGYEEQIGPYKVLYFFPGLQSNESQVPPAGRKRIRAIEARRHLRSDMAASEAWSAQFASVSRALPVQAQCHHVPAGRHTDRATSTDRLAT